VGYRHPFLYIELFILNIFLSNACTIFYFRTGHEGPAMLGGGGTGIAVLLVEPWCEVRVGG
jgi:hypothetical protein